MTDKMKIGFIGAGAMANQVHYPSLQDMDDVEIVAVCDMDQEKLNTTAQKYDIPKTFVDYREMIKDVEMDGIYIIMNPHILFDPVMDALKAKLNVFLEKPPAMTTEQTAKMASLAEQNGCKSLVAFNRRYIPLLRQTKKAVEERGGITLAVGTFYKHIDNGRMYLTSPYDILRYDAIHVVDTLRWIGGEVKQVGSLVRKYDSAVNNTFNAVLEFENGATGVILTNWSAGKRVHTFEMHGPGVSAFIDPDAEAVICWDKKDGERCSVFDVADSKDFYKYYGYYQESRHFIDCLKEDRQPETSLSDAVKTMDLVDRIYQHAM